MSERVYIPPPTVNRFQLDHQHFVRGLMGPIGSGKSVGCAIDLMQMSEEMPADSAGWRRSRNVIVRNTYRELQDTTMRTVFEWMPKHEPAMGTHWAEGEMSWRLRDEKHKFETEWLFRALDRPDHVAKLLSLELTHAWVNEAREVPLSIIDMLQGRLGRFPAMVSYGWKTDAEKVAEMFETGRAPIVGEDIPYWYGLIMDTNPPDDDHWWYRLFEEDRPQGWQLYRQPSARKGKGENLENLHPLYYSRLSAGKSEGWQKVYVDGEYGYVQEGKPCYPEYVDGVHTLKHSPDPVKGLDVYLGGDWGLTPAIIFLQNISGTWVAIDEICSDKLGAVNMARLAREKLNTDFQGCPVRQGWGDPSGGEGSNIFDEEGETVIEVMRDADLPFDPAPTQDPVRRREAVASCLTTLSPAGRPRLMISPKCKRLRKGMNGGYRYRRLQVSGDERFTDKPDKNIYSHPCEALEYVLLGEGEGHQLLDKAEELGARNHRAQAMAERMRASTHRRSRRIA